MAEATINQKQQRIENRISRTMLWVNSRSGMNLSRHRGLFVFVKTRISDPVPGEDPKVVIELVQVMTPTAVSNWWLRACELMGSGEATLDEAMSSSMPQFDSGESEEEDEENAAG